MEIKFTNKKNLVVGCVYRHPNSNISVHDFTYVHLDSILKKISGENKRSTLMGDFNINLLKIDSNDSYNSFYNSLSSHFFTPTRLQSKTLIDNIFFNSVEYQSNSGNLLIEISDHLIQFLILEGSIKERDLPGINLFRRDLSNFNQREFEDEIITKVKWDEIMQSKDPSFACKSFLDTINYYLDEYAPLK